MQMEEDGFDMRKIHMRILIEKGLSIEDWAAFVAHLQQTMDELEDIPTEAKASAVEWLKTTRNDFRPPEPQEIEAWNAMKASKGGACPY